MPELTYLACPYSHPDPAVRLARFEAANRAAAEMMRRGVLVYSPLSHSHSIALAGGLPLDWAFWERMDRAILHACRAVWVLAIEGWRESAGVQAEIALAREMGLPALLVYPPIEGMPLVTADLFAPPALHFGLTGVHPVDVGLGPEPQPSPACPACGGPATERRGTLWCDRCHTKLETCCDGGNFGVERSVVG